MVKAAEGPEKERERTTMRMKTRKTERRRKREAKEEEEEAGGTTVAAAGRGGTGEEGDVAVLSLFIILKKTVF